MSEILAGKSDMMLKTNLLPIVLLFLGGLLPTLQLRAEEELTPEQLQFFESKIRPVLVKECFGCHSNKSGNARGGLRLDTEALMHIGGSSGPAVVPGDVEESLLFNAMNHEDWVMPPKRKLPQSVLNDFREWIEMGAPDPRKTEVTEIQSTVTDEDIEHAKQNFWAYQAPKHHTAPEVEDQAWPRNDIDHFLLAKLEESDMKPAEDAEPFQVLRRLCFDLTGLPPSKDQIEFFNKLWNRDPDKAVTFVVDRLLEKPQFGERWGRHWLDVARYAESTGREVNMTYPHAWRYRDYVIDSFNNDKPFNEFVQEQIAGDLLPVESDEEWAENLVATTFLAIGPKNVNEANRVQFAMDLVDEQIDATSRVFLGMSVACARCHDHKFDAFRQSDYYALAGVFGNMTTYFGNPPSKYGRFQIPQRKQNSSLILLPVDDPNPYDKRYSSTELASLVGQFDELQREAADARRNRNAGGASNANAQRNRIRLANQLSALSDKVAVVDDNGNPLSYCMGVQEKGAPRDARILVRGEIDQLGPAVQRGLPEVLLTSAVDIAAGESGRLEFARWLGSDQNTLTARVMVNRIWQELFGKGLVTSTENFGVTGSAPSHPELLDQLAVQFVESGWSIKTMIRQIATSRAYRMKSTFDENFHELDPENSMLWRANPRRLDAEALRDAMLSVSGSIDLERPRGSEVAKAGYTRVRDGVLGDAREIGRKTMESIASQMRSSAGGRGAGRFGAGNMRAGNRGRFGAGRGSFGSTEDRQSIIADAVRKVTNQLDMEESTMRSVYLPIVRDEVPRSLEVFDFADANSIIGTREESNTSNQALYMLNNPFVIDQSIEFAKRIAAVTAKPAEQIQLAFELAYGRSPTSREREAAVGFIRSYVYGSDPKAPPALAALCQSLFASAEFRFID